MTKKGTSISGMEAATDLDDPETIDAFERLANETRLAILLALWDAYEPFEDEGALSFSALRERVGMRDKGQFYYHLDKLVDHFVRQTDDGYELRSTGRKLVRAIIADPGFTEEDVPRTAIDKPCPHCGATTAVTYENECLVQVCAECPGTFSAPDDFPDGTLTVWPLSRAGLADRTAAEQFAAGTLITIREYALMLGGVCPKCSGVVDASVDICRDHEPPADGLCPACDRRYEIQARLVCDVCKNKMWGPPSILLAAHPDVIAFFASRGVDLGYETTDFDGCVRYMQLIRDHDEARLIREEPVRIRLSFRCAGDELAVTLAADLSVVGTDLPD